MDYSVHEWEEKSLGEWIDQAAWSLLHEDMFSALLVTRGPDGMTLFERENGNLRRQDISSLAHVVDDVTGAGDTALCVFALTIAAGAERSHAAHTANVAAGINRPKATYFLCSGRRHPRQNP